MANWLDDQANQTAKIRIFLSTSQSEAKNRDDNNSCPLESGYENQYMHDIHVSDHLIVVAAAAAAVIIIIVTIL